MRTESLLALVLIVPFFSCADVQAQMTGTHRPEISAGLHERKMGPAKDAFEFDIIQRTCALYVAVRSLAFETPVEFGREIDDSMVHWNKCPGGNMVACVVAPTANGDTVVTGIPFPY